MNSDIADMEGKLSEEEALLIGATIKTTSNKKTIDFINEDCIFLNNNYFTCHLINENS